MCSLISRLVYKNTSLYTIFDKVIKTTLTRLLFFIIISWIPAAAAAAVAEALDHADDGDSQEEAHQATQLSNELDPVLREVVDVLVLHWPHEELQNDGVWGSTLDCLTWSCNLLLYGRLLSFGVRGECRIEGVSRNSDGWLGWLNFHFKVRMYKLKYQNRKLTHSF